MTTLSFKQLEALWINAGGARALAPLMAAIAMGESSGDPNSVNSIGCTGLWQINVPVHEDLVAKYGDMKNPENNAKAAVSIYHSQGLGAWEAYTNGSYKKYLPKAKSAFDQLGDDLSGILNSLTGNPAEGASQLASGLSGMSLSLPSSITDAFDAAEKVVKGMLWIINPSHWARIIAGVMGFLLLGAGLIALGMAA
jgi:hypothetical protein